MDILPATIYRVNNTPHRNSDAILHSNWNKILNFIWKYKGPRMNKTIFNSNETDGAITIPDSSYTTELSWWKLSGAGKKTGSWSVASRTNIELTHSNITWFVTNRLQYTLEKIVSSTNGSLILLCSYLEMDEIQSLSLTLHKTQLQTDQRHQHRIWLHEPDREKNR